MPRGGPVDSNERDLFNDGFSSKATNSDPFKSGLQDMERQVGRSSKETAPIWESITNELTKSYGFRRDGSTGQWSWSIDNIATAFKEDPIWTTLDWASLALGPAKVGLAAAGIARGAKAAGVVGKAFKAGEFAGKEAKTVLGRGLDALSSGLGAATELKLAGPSRLGALKIPGTQRTFGISNPLTTELSDDYLRLIDRYGGEIWENKAVAKSLEKEKLVAETMFSRKAEDITKQWTRSGVNPRIQGAAVRLLERGADPESRAATRLFANSPEALDAYKNTWAFRNTIHEESYKLGLISEETYAANLKTYSPRIYEEWEKVRGALGELNPKVTKIPGQKVVAEGTGEAAGSIVKGGAARYQGRSKDSLDHLTRIWDPSATLSALAQAGQTIAKQKYAQGLAKSVIAKDTTDVVDLALDIVQKGDVKRAALHGIKSEQVDAMRRLLGGLNDVNREIRGEEVAKLMGWKRIEDLYQGDKMPAYLANLPNEFKGKWLDPLAANDIKGTLEVLGEDGVFKSFYKKAVGTFRASKTAYNPGTHVRNMLGAAVFSHLATGGRPSFVPLKGIAEFKAQGEAYKAAIEAGILGSAFDAEIHGALARAADLKAKTAIDWLPDNFVTSAAKKGAGAMETFYRNTDEVFKLDAWIRLTEKYSKNGTSLEQARNLAKRDVEKFMPNFLMHSELGNVLRQGVPFASFTTEALRIWKNVLAEKPHLAYFYNHVAESMSQTFGALSGYSPDQVEEAQKALPSHLQGKKTLLLPFNIDGQPQFLDLSYVIPMGNIAEAQDSERLFFTSVIDPTTNPFVNLASAAATGKDAFSGRDIEPSFTERQLGVAVTGEQSRKIVGLAEHTLRMFLPPLAPPGYAGTNILESVRGQVNPATMEGLEHGVFKTVLANVSSFRTYAPDVESQVKNVQEESRKLGEKVAQSWKRWEFARANGDVKTMEQERERIIAFKDMEGDDDPVGYFESSIQSRGPFSKLSTRQLEETLKRAQRLGELSPRDEKIRAELLARYRMRKSKSSGR